MKKTYSKPEMAVTAFETENPLNAASPVQVADEAAGDNVYGLAKEEASFDLWEDEQ